MRRCSNSNIRDFPRCRCCAGRERSVGLTEPNGTYRRFEGEKILSANINRAADHTFHADHVPNNQGKNLNRMAWLASGGCLRITARFYNDAGDVVVSAFAASSGNDDGIILLANRSEITAHLDIPSCQYNVSAGTLPRFHIASNCTFT